MRRRYRLLLTGGALAASVALVLALLVTGDATEGPLARILRGLGTAVGKLESQAARRARGSSRADSLAWLRRYRDDRAAVARPDTMLLGAFDDGMPRTLDGVLSLERRLGTALPIMQLYAAWGDKPEEKFPDRVVAAIHEIGSIPLVTWEPWLTDFENQLHPNLPLRDQRERGGLASVVRGDYDFYIDEWARAAAAAKHVVMVRFAHEMNDPYRYPWGPQNNDAGAFVAAWRHVVDRCRAAGATNVVWVWSPHLAHAGWETYYPGADYVDWIATGVLNYGTVAYWSKWWTFDEIFGKHYATLVRYDKPIMIAEFGSVAVGGDRAAWLENAIRDIRTNYPRVRALLFFNVAHDRTVTYEAIDWTIDSTLAARLGGSLRSTR